MQDDRAAAMDGLRALTDWAAGMSPDRIPPAMLARAAAVLADDFGAIVAASSEPEVARFHAMTLDRRADAEATVFRGGRSRTGRQNAAVANGLAACWLELDEGYRKASCHAGLYIVPALLAEAEATDMPVMEVLRTLVLAYEIVTRFAMTWNSPGRHVHSHAQFCAVGAAAAVALARRLPADELRNVLAMASTLVTVGPRNHVVRGALVRNAWSAAGAWSGMMCVDWAACGLNGSADAPHDVFGTIFQAPTEAECLSAGLGESWAVQDGYTKLYACCRSHPFGGRGRAELAPRDRRTGARRIGGHRCRDASARGRPEERQPGYDTGGEVFRTARGRDGAGLRICRRGRVPFGHDECAGYRPPAANGHRAPVAA